MDPIPLPTRPLPQPTRQEAPARIIAMGDIHGDIQAMRTAFRLANLIDEDDAWIGGETVVVSNGDIGVHVDFYGRLAGELARTASAVSVV